MRPKGAIVKAWTGVVLTPKSEARLTPNRIHNGQRTPGPGSPVATTRDENTVDKHGLSVAKPCNPIALPKGNFPVYLCLQAIFLCETCKKLRFGDTFNIPTGPTSHKERGLHLTRKDSMRYFKHLNVAILGLLLSMAAHAAPIEIAGVQVEDSAMVAGTKLQLNGAGIRYKAIFKVYVGELHTSKKVSSLDELIAAPGPKRLTMTFLRDMEAGAFGKLLTRGMEDNTTKSEFVKLVPGLIRMGELFTATKSIQKGEKITLDWIPGTGMIITVKGKVQGQPFVEPEFFKATMSIWFGSSPADWRLKDAMLGITNPKTP
jgi:hypothetical protein